MSGQTSHGTGFALIFAEVSSRYGFDKRDKAMVKSQPNVGLVQWSPLRARSHDSPPSFLPIPFGVYCRVFTPNVSKTCPQECSQMPQR